MSDRDRRRIVLLGLFAVASGLAPAAWQDPPPPPPPAPAADAASLARLRVEAGTKAYDTAWLYYSENRVDSEKVYRSSKRLLDARLDGSADKPGQAAACQEHLDRIKKLEFKIQRIRRIGFGDSLDVVEVDYYRKEAEFWLAQAKAR